MTTNNPVRQLIAKRLSELKKKKNGLTMAEISRQLDRNPTWLHQFISRGTPTELEERDRLKLGKILQLNPDDLKCPGRTRKWSRSFDWRDDPLELTVPLEEQTEEVVLVIKITISKPTRTP